MPAVANSIIDDTKLALGVPVENTEFDTEIIMHINAVIAEMTQLGIGDQELGYAVVNSSDTWDELIANEKRLNHVKSLMYLKVKMLFDPPTIGYVLTSMEKLIEKAEWRVMVAKDDIDKPYEPPLVLPAIPWYYDPFADDGGV